MSDTRAKILAVLQEERGFLAGLATVDEDGAPWVRYVMGTIDDELTIRIATSLHSKKVAHVGAQPNVHLTCGNTDPSVDAPYFQIEGRAEICTEVAEKRAVWRDELALYFETPENPDWCVLKVHPSWIAIHSMSSPDTEFWTPQHV